MSSLLPLLLLGAVLGEQAPCETDDEGCTAPVQLVQLKTRLTTDADGTTGADPTALFVEPAEPDRSFLPLAWLHVPKCGSSFLNALIKIPGACPGVPKDVVISDQTMGFDNIGGFITKYPPPLNCPGTFQLCCCGSHRGVGDEESFNATWRGRGFTILRRPEQREVSSYKDNRHSWPLAVGNLPPNNTDDYFDQIQGCAVRMLTRAGISAPVPELNNYHAVGPHWGGPCGEGPLPTAEEVVEAKRRLGLFKFVGLLEEWELSICLFHATVGGPCYASEFINTRHNGTKHVYNETKYDVDDPYDSELYEEGKKIFWERFTATGLTADVCQTCFKQAGVEYP